MGTLSAHHLESILGKISKDNPDDYKLIDVVALAQMMAESINESTEKLDSKLYKEFRLIAEHISKMKEDIANIQTSSLSNVKIPEAGRELSEIVKSTEEATHKIMESAEAIMSSDPADTEKYPETVNGSVMDIFEACSFQDLTGQRVSRVMETLEFIDRRLVHLDKTMGEIAGNKQLFDEEVESEKRKQDLILHGPQDKGKGENQDDIDALFD